MPVWLTPVGKNEFVYVFEEHYNKEDVQYRSEKSKQEDEDPDMKKSTSQKALKASTSSKGGKRKRRRKKWNVEAHHDR